MGWNEEEDYLHACAVIWSYYLAQALIIVFNDVEPASTVALVALHAALIDVGCDAIKTVRVTYIIYLFIVVITARSLISTAAISAVWVIYNEKTEIWT